MKKHLLSLTLLTILTSCSLNNHFLKRKYTKGVYFETITSTNKTHSSNKVSDASQKSHSVYFNNYESTDLINHNQNTHNQPLTAIADFHKPTTAQNTHHSLSASLKNKSSSQKNTVYNDYSDMSQILPIHKAHHFYNSSASQPSDDDRIIWVILAIFPVLCLIAIYLHDGKKLTTNFWIDLILHLLLIGAVIFALLVVLDVVNLN
ncbi:MAG: hypothetical protein N2203_06950 [Bacteroidia bacterium]|nr:hypothetical protein [Bacteroidia bacterium]